VAAIKPGQTPPVPHFEIDNRAVDLAALSEAVAELVKSGLTRS